MRLEHWPQALEKAIEDAREKPFEWGQHDCCLFAAACVDAITGREIAARYRGRYKDAKGARRILKKDGGLEAIADDLFDRIHPGLAQRGDLVLMDIDIGGMKPLGIVDLSCRSVAVTGPEGITFLHRRAALIAWRVA